MRILVLDLIATTVAVGAYVGVCAWLLAGSTADWRVCAVLVSLIGGAAVNVFLGKLGNLLRTVAAGKAAPTQALDNLIAQVRAQQLADRDRKMSHGGPVTSKPPLQGSQPLAQGMRTGE